MSKRFITFNGNVPVSATIYETHVNISHACVQSPALFVGLIFIWLSSFYAWVTSTSWTKLTQKKIIQRVTHSTDLLHMKLLTKIYFTCMEMNFVSNVTMLNVHIWQAIYTLFMRKHSISLRLCCQLFVFIFRWLTKLFCLLYLNVFPCKFPSQIREFAILMHMWYWPPNNWLSRNYRIHIAETEKRASISAMFKIPTRKITDTFVHLIDTNADMHSTDASSLNQFGTCWNYSHQKHKTSFQYNYFNHFNFNHFIYI